ncbi:bifunctional nuclease-like [Panicum miliaceum]|uniref:Bifunctional nuclease-like n=1 Tax=Panicum miliaceum TaxID=4540 RepID=A0A3L6RYL9_PANMI|nr:bifunctional nuclease-like [Panicum miliaceum]
MGLQNHEDETAQRARRFSTAQRATARATNRLPPPARVASPAVSLRASASPATAGSRAADPAKSKPPRDGDHQRGGPSVLRRPRIGRPDLRREGQRPSPAAPARAPEGKGLRAASGLRQLAARYLDPRSPRRHGRSDWGGWPARCSYGSSSDGGGAAAANFDASGEEFVIEAVLAVELRSVSDGFEIKMRDGKKPRPTIYNVVMEMTKRMGYEIRLVRITEMAHGACYSRLYLAKVGDEEDTISFDLKPSDAINIASRCKIRIEMRK